VSVNLFKAEATTNNCCYVETSNRK